MRNKTLIAIHKKEKIVRKFISQQEDEKLEIVRLKNNLLLQDKENLYLIKCKDIYVPYELYNVYTELYEQVKYDFNTSIKILENVKVMNNLSKKDIKCISKTIDILKSIIEDDTVSPDINTLKSIKEFKEDYNLIIKE